MSFPLAPVLAVHLGPVTYMVWAMCLLPQHSDVYWYRPALVPARDLDLRHVSAPSSACSRTIWQFLICCFIKIGPPSAQKVHQKYIQDIQYQYNISSGRRPGPAQPSPGPRGPGARARPRAWPEPSRAGGRLVFYLGYL